MTGPEHYKRAEELLRAVQPDARHGNGTPVVYDQPETLAAAQAHATLALAAATALQIRGADTVAWEATAGPRTHGHG